MKWQSLHRRLQLPGCRRQSKDAGGIFARGNFSRESLSLLHRQIDWQSHINRQRRELAHSAPLWPARSGQERRPWGRWEPGQQPLSAPFVGSQSQFAKQHMHLAQHNCQPTNTAHCPTDVKFPCLMRETAAAAARALDTLHWLRRQRMRQGEWRLTARAGPGWTARKELAHTWPPTALSRGQFC